MKEVYLYYCLHFLAVGDRPVLLPYTSFLPSTGFQFTLIMFSYLLTSGQNLCTLSFYHLEHMDLFKCKLHNIGSGQE